MARKPQAGQIKHDHEEQMNSIADGNVEGVREILKEKRLEQAEQTVKAKNLKDLRELMRTPIVIKNYPVREFKELSHEVVDHVVSFFFPVAMDEGKTAPTYVDAPVNPRQLAMCHKKAALMEKLGRRYFIFQEQNLISTEMLKQQMTNNKESMTDENHIEVL